MRITHLVKRVVIDLGVVLATVLLVVGSIAGYVWVKEGPQRAEAKKQFEAMLGDETAEANALAALGDVNLDPPTLTLAVLEQTLHPHQQASKPYGPQNYTTLGWACGGKSCAIAASFLVPFGQEIPPSTVPGALRVRRPRFGAVHNVNVAIGGVHLGESVEEMKEFCQKRGYGQETGSHRMTWNKDWSLGWGDWDGKVSILSFANDKMIQSAKAGGGIQTPAPLGVSERNSK
jgi:hypothetical protein